MRRRTEYAQPVELKEVEPYRRPIRINSLPRAGLSELLEVPRSECGLSPTYPPADVMRRMEMMVSSLHQELW